MKKKNVLIILLLIQGILFSYSQETNDLKLQKQENWIAKKIQKMNLSEKIGQLFMVAAYGKKDKKQEKILKKLVKKYKVGGLIFMKGTPYEQLRLTNILQRITKTPLMIGIDGEWGLAMRLKNTFAFPYALTLGALDEAALAEKLGKSIALHCKRMGIHINFAPDVDININPKNPIIGQRSFGQDKKQVVKIAAAFIKGMQSQKILACLKHFPGHGDTQNDSHYTLPLLPFSKKRMQEIELYPYEKLIPKNVKAVMVGHLSIPSLEPNSKKPSATSQKIVTDLLQKKYGYKALIFTDGLTMKGVVDYTKKNEAALQCFLAGNDVLLIPKNPIKSIEKMKKAFRKGLFTIGRLEHSVRKILRAKYWAGLYEPFQKITSKNLLKDLNTEKDTVLNRQILAKTLTLIKNKENSFPIFNLEKKNFAYLNLGSDTGNYFLKTLRNYTTIKKIPKTNLKNILEQLKNIQTLIIGYHTSDKTPWKPYEISDKDAYLLKEISRKKKVILAVFANPYSLIKLPTQFVKSIVIAYQNNPSAQDICAQSIFGALPISGHLPVEIQGKFKLGTKIITPLLKRLSYGIPKSVGMHKGFLQKIDSLMHKSILDSVFPGGQILVGRYGKVIYHKAFGYHTYQKKRKVTLNNLYDLASLTKILAGLPLLLKAYDLGMCSLDTPWKNLFPKLQNSNKDTLTFQEIFSHKARLKSWIPFYRETLDSITQKKIAAYYSTFSKSTHHLPIAENTFLISTYKDSIYQKIKEIPQREKDTYLYSGLPFYLLPEFSRNHFQKELNVFLQENYYKPLGAKTLTFLPLRKFKKQQIVPSEKDTYWRKQIIQGYVHDMGAAMMGGVSANAGLFGTSNDVAKMMQLFLQKGFYGGKRYFSEKTFAIFNHRYYEKDSIRRGLILDKPQMKLSEENTCGCVSEESFGHSGFTGTYAWADPKTQVIYVFLSNRTYPTMENNKISERDIRTKVQEFIQRAIEKP